MSYEEELKTLVPQIHRSKSVDEFLEATGSVLDGFRDAINDLSNATDFELVDERRVDLIAQEIGVEFLRSISLDRKRQLLREAIDLYRTNGTEKSLYRIFKLIGWDVTLEYCWIIDPDWFSAHGNTYILTNDEGAETPITNYQIVFGEEDVTTDGVFVTIKDQFGNLFPKRPIYHENYRTKVVGPSFVKVPYIRIVVTAEDYQLFIKPSTNAVTNQIYEYSDDERFQILQDLRNYFIEQTRPAHVVIYEMSTPFQLEDKITYMFFEDFQIQTLNAGAKFDGTLVCGGYDIDRYVPGETMGGFRFGQSDMNYYGIGESAPEQRFTRRYAAGTRGRQLPLLLRKNTQLILDVPDDTTVMISASKQNGKQVMSSTPDWRNAEWEHIISVSDVSNYPVEIEGFLTMSINITSPSSQDITMEVVYK